MIRGQVFNLQRFSVHDGTGIRTTVFLKGCPLRCVWCHNPESMRQPAELMVVEGRCIHCGECIEACPTGRLEAEQAGAVNDAPECTLCGTCTDVCPVEARQLVGRSTTVPELVAEVLKDRIFFDDSGGGVTFSGGEPLAQPQFLAAALEAFRREGIRTAVDTCGFCRQADLLRIAPLVDLFLFDLKVMDEDRHREFTGVSGRPILANLEALARAHPDIWVRVPVIPGFNDRREDLAAIARFVTKLPGVRRVHLLPYHPHGEHKRERLGQTVQLEGVGPPPPERLTELAGELAAQGLEPHIGG